MGRSRRGTCFRGWLVVLLGLLAVACSEAEVRFSIDDATARADLARIDRLFEEMNVKWMDGYSDSVTEHLISNGYFVMSGSCNNRREYGAESYRLADSFIFVFQGESFIVQQALPLTRNQKELWPYKETIYENLDLTAWRVRRIAEYRSLAKEFRPGEPFREGRIPAFVAHLYLKTYGEEIDDTGFFTRYSDSSTYNGIAAAYVHEIVHLKYDSSPPHPSNIFALAREERTAAVAPACLGYESPWIALATVAFWMTLPGTDPHRLAGENLAVKIEFTTGKNLFQLGELSEKQLLDLFWEIEGDAIRSLGLRPQRDP